MSGLSILALGHLTFEQVSTLQPHFSALELIDSTLPGDVRLPDRGPEVNRAAAAGANLWVLILREGETVPAQLAEEIKGAIDEQPQAWGYRIRIQPTYAGRPLLLGSSPGEIRLFHRRHARFDVRSRGSEMKIEGTVVRLRHPVVRVTFPTAEDHVRFLRERGVPHSWPRRLLVFSRNALLSGAWYRSRTTLQYLWLEAGFDTGGAKSEERGANSAE